MNIVKTMYIDIDFKIVRLHLGAGVGRGADAEVDKEAGGEGKQEGGGHQGRGGAAGGGGAAGRGGAAAWPEPGVRGAEQRDAHHGHAPAHHPHHADAEVGPGVWSRFD